MEDTVNNQECNITGILIGQVPNDSKYFAIINLFSGVLWTEQGTSILHLLEGPCFSVLHVLKCLAEHPHFKEHGAQSGRIISNIEDRPERFYPEWYSATIQERRSTVEEVTADSCKDISFDLSQALQEVGRDLQSEAQGEVELDK